MITKCKPEPESPSIKNTNSVPDRATTAPVVCFSTIQKNKKLAEAKRRVYQASTNLNW